MTMCYQYKVTKPMYHSNIDGTITVYLKESTEFITHTPFRIDGKYELIAVWKVKYK